MAMYLVHVLSITLNNILYWYSTVSIPQCVHIGLHGHKNTMNWTIKALSYVDAKDEESRVKRENDFPKVIIWFNSEDLKVTFRSPDSK